MSALSASSPGRRVGKRDSTSARKEASEATSKGDRRDTSEDVASPEWIVVKFAPPSDVGFEGDFNALFPHGVFAGREDFFVEGVEHVHSKVEPVAVKLMARSEAAVGGAFSKRVTLAPSWSP